MPDLIIEFMSGPLDGQTITLAVSGAEVCFILGRGQDCDVVIPYDDRVSRHHALLTVRKGHCLLEDTASRNGTFLDVNNQRLIEPHGLPTGALFRLGDTRLRIQSFAHPQTED